MGVDSLLAKNRDPRRSSRSFVLERPPVCEKVFNKTGAFFLRLIEILLVLLAPGVGVDGFVRGSLLFAFSSKINCICEFFFT